MNNAAIVVPWRTAEGREKSFELAQKYNAETFSDFKFYFSDSVGEKFNVSEARNRGCIQAIEDGYNLLVVLDADTVFERDAVVDALKVVTESGGVCYPYTLSIETNQQLSERIDSGELTLEDLSWHMDATEMHVGSGWVMSSETFWEMNGWDENFKGWGWEDAAFQLAYETKFDRIMSRSEGTCYRFWHPVRDTYSFGENLYRYESEYTEENISQLLLSNMVHRSNLD